MANTPNYSLLKPDRTDNINDVDTSLANNFTIIDTEIKNRKDEIDGHIAGTNGQHTSEAILHADGSVKATLDNHESRLGANETELTDHEGRLTDIETLGIDKLAPDLEGRLSTVENDVEGFLAPATMDGMSQQGYTFDEYRIGYVDNKLVPINEQLADIATFVNADKTGVTPASSSINNLIASASDGDEIRFHKGTYLIDSPIIWNKKVTLVADGRVTLKASANIEAIIKATGFTSYTDVHLNGFFLDGNNKANHCILLDGSSLYTVKTVIDNCECRNAVLDGIRIIPPSWTVTIRNTLSNSNGRDGLRSIMTSNPGVNQLNHIMIDSCTFNDNTGDGINILGVINTITNCDIENNSMGIRMDATQCADPYASFHLNIVDNYIEGNKTNQIYASTNTGDGIVLNVKGNYINSANLGGAIIKCVGISEAMTLNLGENRFESSVTNTVMLDGGNCLNSSSLIISDVYLNESKFINLGFARIIQDMFGTIMLPSSMSTAPSNNVQASDDITLKTPKKVEYPVPIDLQFKLLKLLQAKIVTNATSYNITCTVKVIDLLGNEVRSIPYTITGTANQTWSVYITNDWGYYRIPKENFVTVSFLVNSITAGSYITINNVCLSCI